MPPPVSWLEASPLHAAARGLRCCRRHQTLTAHASLPPLLLALPRPPSLACCRLHHQPRGPAGAAAVWAAAAGGGAGVPAEAALPAARCGACGGGAQQGAHSPCCPWMDLLRLATACFALLPLDVVAVPSPRAPAPAGGAGRGACAQKNDGGEGTVCRTRIAGAQALQLPYLLLRACVQGTGQGGGAGVDLPDGGTAPEVAITLPDADPMVLFAAGAAADLFPTFEPDLLSIGGGVELGGGGRGLFQGGSDSLTVAEDISGVYGGGDGRYWPGRARCAAGVLPCLPRSAAHCSPSLSPSLAHPCHSPIPAHLQSCLAANGAALGTTSASRCRTTSTAGSPSSWSACARRRGRRRWPSRGRGSSSSRPLGRRATRQVCAGGGCGGTGICLGQVLGQCCRAAGRLSVSPLPGASPRWQSCLLACGPCAV